MMYVMGWGVGRNDVAALMWFIRAAAQGDEDAATRIPITTRAMTPEQIAEAERLAAQPGP